MVSSTISASIGGLMTFVEIILTVLIGSTLLKNFNYSLKEKMYAVKSGQITQDEFVKSSMGKAIGAILLMVPGFFTDILGILLQFSFFTTVVGLIFKFKTPANNSSYQTNKGENDDVIDVEIIDNSKHIDK
jgi:2-isopropylmalate synthase/UPF0716 protein FxsA